MNRVSEDFLIRLKLAEQPAYRIAQQAGVNPTELSKLINGIIPVKEKDERIARVAKVLGLKPEEAFASEKSQ